jgi:hypothetical protein
MAVIHEQPDARWGGNRRDLEASLTCIGRCLSCSAIFFQSFGIEEKRGIFWWSLHRLLDAPEGPISYKELYSFLAKTAANNYTHHHVKTALISMQKQSYVSLSRDGIVGHPKLRDIKKNTLIKLERPFFEAIKKYGNSFRTQVSDGREIALDDLSLYNRLPFAASKRFINV